PSPSATTATRPCEPSQVAGRPIHPPMPREGRNEQAWKEHHITARRSSRERNRSASAVPSSPRKSQVEPPSLPCLGERGGRASLEGAAAPRRILWKDAGMISQPSTQSHSLRSLEVWKQTVSGTVSWRAAALSCPLHSTKIFT